MSEGKPSILHLRGSDFFGSPERLISGQMKYLTGFDNYCGSFVRRGGDNQFLKKIRALGLNSLEIEDNHLFDMKIPGRLTRLLKTHKIDLLITHEYKSNFYGYLASRGIKIPQIGYFHGWTEEDLKVKFYNFLDRRILKRLDGIITVSRFTADRLAQAGVPKEIIKVVYNAIEPDDDIPPLKEVNERRLIGVIGRLSFEKGVHIFLQSLALIRQEAPPFKAEIYGSGPEENKLHRMTRELGLSDLVSFEGFINDLDEVYGKLDFLVLPSLSEGHPLVILEAWKRGIGIVAARAGGIPEIIEDGENGILADAGNAEDLGKAVIYALRNPNLMRKYGYTGFELIRSKYNFAQQSKLLAEIYEETLAARRV